MKLNNIDSLRGMHQDHVRSIIKEYHDRSFDSIDIDRESHDQLRMIAERYYGKLNREYPIRTIYLSLYWYLYFKIKLKGKKK